MRATGRDRALRGRRREGGASPRRTLRAASCRAPLSPRLAPDFPVLRKRGGRRCDAPPSPRRGHVRASRKCPTLAPPSPPQNAKARACRHGLDALTGQAINSQMSISRPRELPAARFCLNLGLLLTGRLPQRSPSAQWSSACGAGDTSRRGDPQPGPARAGFSRAACEFRAERGEVLARYQGEGR